MESATRAYQDVSLKHQRDELILEHLEYVRHILGRIAVEMPRDVDFENLESAGVLGLVEAARQYDFRPGVAFTTFSYPRIRGAILDELRRNCPLPQKLLSQLSRVRRACETLPLPVMPEAIAEETGLSLDDIEQCLQADRLTRCEIWDDTVEVSASPRLQSTASPDSTAELRDTKQALADSIEGLPEKERLVVALYYLEDLRLKEIGQVLGLSESRVSRLLAKAQFRLKQLMLARGE